MAKVTRVVVTALKDNVSITTAKKKLQFRKVDGLPNGGMPEGQDEVYENAHGISLVKDQIVELDLKDEQFDYFRQAVARGDIECDGLPPAPAPSKAASK